VNNENPTSTLSLAKREAECSKEQMPVLQSG